MFKVYIHVYILSINVSKNILHTIGNEMWKNWNTVISMTVCKSGE